MPICKSKRTMATELTVQRLLTSRKGVDHFYCRYWEQEDE